MLDEDDLKFLNDFIPFDTAEVRARLRDLSGRHFEGNSLCEASDGDVDRFIQEQYDLRHLAEISYEWKSEWSYIQGQLEKKKPVLYKDRLINPVKLNISNYLRRKEDR